MINNIQIANALESIANFLEEAEENNYRIKAYRKAAKTIKGLPYNVSELVANHDDLTTIKNVGAGIAKLITEMVEKNNLAWMPKAKPAEIYPEHLLTRKKSFKGYRIYATMLSINRIINRLKAIPEITNIELTGELRRKKEVIHDIEIIITTKNPKQVFEKITLFPSVKYFKILTNQMYMQLKAGLKLIITVVPIKIFSAELLKKTGSEEHYQILTQLADKKNYPINKSTVTEEKIYQELELQYIPPELRENRGEIQAAKKFKLPKLIELADIKGDLHSHTIETDGNYTLEEMVAAAIQQGYQYVAITDHSQSLKITNGMDEKRLLKQIEQIDKLNQTIKNFTILKSMEIDILEDGSLDLSNEVLKELDITVCSIHSKFRMPLEKQTVRVLRAMDNPYFNILGHATGRLINYRPAYEIDIDRILQAAKERNCFLEVNAQPYRLDINDIYCRKAKELGVKVAISSDAHTVNGFNFMVLGVNQARRGWLEAKDVLNTYELTQLRKLLKK